MIADWNTNTIYLSGLLKSRFPGNYNQIIEVLNACGLDPKPIRKTNDIWARDYMPIQISDDKYIEYRYDPDYLQKPWKGYRDTKTYPDIVCDEHNLKTIKCDIILDGGNIVKSDNSIILTEKVVLENRSSYTRKALIKRLTEIFEVDKLVIIHWDRMEPFGHADGMVRFIDNDTVLISEHYKDDQTLKYRLKQNGFNVEVLKVKMQKVRRNNWAYINYLQTKDVILLPRFGEIEENQKTFEQICSYFPKYAEQNRILQIEMSDIVRHGGALNCISWTTRELLRLSN